MPETNTKATPQTEQIWLRCDKHDIEFKSRSLESTRHATCRVETIERAR